MKTIPPLKALNVFLVAAQQQSFKKAAELMFVSESAISQQIRILEDYFQCKLFQRMAKKMVLSDKGRMLLPHIETAFAEIKSGVAKMHGDQQPNKLTITSLHSITSIFLIPKIRTFQQDVPGLTIQFSPSNQLERFDSGEVDLAIRIGKGSYPGLMSTKLSDYKLILVASPRLFNKTNVATLTASEVFSYPFLEDTSDDMQSALTVCLEKYALRPENLPTVLKIDDSVPIIDAALAGEGIAIVSELLVAEHIKRGQLIALLDFAFVSQYHIYLVAPPEHFQWQKIRQFEHWLRSAIASTKVD